MHFLGHSWKQTFIVKIPSHLQVFLLLAVQRQVYKTKHVGTLKVLKDVAKFAKFLSFLL